ncbi:MAG: hypothetical protein ACT4P6_14265 [Gemmatimonadaceae bacterium]
MPNVSHGTLAAVGRGVRRFHVAVVVAIFALSCESPRSQRETSPARAATCAVAETTAVTGQGLGELRIGATVQKVRTACDVARDSTIARGNEAMPERRIAVVLGTDTVEAIVESDWIRRLEVTTPRFRTSDSLGVGTSAGALRARDATLAVGDRGVFALVPAHCGISFHLAGMTPAQGSWAAIPDSTLVDRVLVFGC